MQVSVLENGQIGDHSHDPWYYQRTIAIGDLPVLTLNTYDLDDDPTYPNYNSSYLHSRVFLLNFTAFEERNIGTFYFLNETEITVKAQNISQVDIDIPWNASMNCFCIRYRPPLNRHSSTANSTFASVAFYAVQTKSGLKTATSFVNVTVQKVIKPPEPVQNLALIAYSRLFTKFELKGQPDEGQTIKSGRILSLPKSGQLYGVTSNGTVITAVPLAINSTVNMTTDNQLQLAYFYNGTETLHFTNSTFLADDEFMFEVLDNSGLHSIPAKYSISATTAMFCTERIFHVLEDNITELMVSYYYHIKSAAPISNSNVYPL